MSCNTFILSTFFLFGLEHDFLLFIYATSFLNTSRKQMLKHNRIADKLQIVIICRTKYFFPRETTFASRFFSTNFAVVWLNVLLFFQLCNTPLMYAARNNHPHSCQELLLHGADFRLHNLNGDTAHVIAVENNSTLGEINI